MAMEVFTISGAAFGASVSPVWSLQNALKALGEAHGDNNLGSVGIDGKLGPKTVSALNYALKTYIGAKAVQDFKLGGRFLNATATVADVQQGIGQLVALVTRTVKLQGGNVPPPPAGASHSSGSSSSAMRAQADAAIQDNTGTASAHPYLVWIVGGAALLVAFVGFTAARRRANA